MRKILLVLLVTIISVSVTYAQKHTIAYDVNLSVTCDGFEGMLMGSGSIVEGQSIQFPSYKIPTDLTFLQGYQSILDVFSEATIEVPEGTLKENVTFKIMLNPITCEYENIGYEELFGMTVKVVGESSGEHAPFGYYMFNDGKQIVLKLKAAKLFTYLSEQKLTFEQLFGWFVTEGLLADENGISFHYTLGDEWLKIYLSHFSKIAIGIDNSLTDVNIIRTLPIDYQLAQNYPNPFNPSTTINYSLPKDGFTKLTVYNSIGVEVKTLVSENKTAGNYSLSFNAGNLPSGIYFYDLSSGNFRSTKKMILIK